MANNQDIWFDKLKSWVPQWFFEEEQFNVAVFQGIAKLLNEMECMLDNHIRETFLCQAVNGYLDEHGLERNLKRFLGELDTTFRERIKNLTNTTSCPAVKLIVDALLDVGESLIIEDFNGSLFFNRENFISRGEIMINPIYNTFSIIVDKQIHEPYSFYDRENFLDREDFIGLSESRLELFQLIVEHVNKSKSLGTLYRLIERLE